MPRLPPAGRPGKRGPKPARGERAGRRVEVWFTPTEDATLEEHLGRRATAADVRDLALQTATPDRERP